MRIEGAIHVMTSLFEAHANDGHALLLLDAKNAFNSNNRKAALLIARKKGPRASTFLYNIYQGQAELVVAVWSCEGSTQGYPLSKLFYGMV